jgi:hypothetical protein
VTIKGRRFGTLSTPDGGIFKMEIPGRIMGPGVQHAARSSTPDVVSRANRNGIFLRAKNS